MEQEKQPGLGGSIYTLAQSGTGTKSKEVKLICGNGSDLNDTKALKGRAKRKFVGQNLTLKLIDVAKAINDEEKIQSYWNTYHCQNQILSSRGRLFTKYCKNRFCPVCCSIRKADIINRYLPLIDSWSDPHCIVLTVKAIKGKSLRAVIESMLKMLKKIINKYKKLDQRKQGKKLIGIRALESCYNPEAETYNPHFHIIVAERWMAEVLIDEWVRRAKPKKVNRAGQFMRRARNKREKDLMEVVKYTGKIINEPKDDDNIIGDDNITEDNAIIYSAALANIYTAMKGHRIFERFGFNAPTRRAMNSGELSLVINYDSWDYDPQLFDWVNSATKERLSEYEPSQNLRNLLRWHIDTEKQ